MFERKFEESCIGYADMYSTTMALKQQCSVTVRYIEIFQFL